MKLHRTALLAAVEARLESGSKAHAAKQAKAAKDYDRRLTRWRETKAPELAKALDAMAKRAKRGTPVTGEEVRSVTGWSSRDRDLTWAGGTAPTEEPYSNVDMEALRAFLLTLQDDTVTTQQLAALGWRNLERLYREAATG